MSNQPVLRAPTKVEVITHYFEHDKQFLSDYASIEVRMEGQDPRWAATFSYSDGYHDNSQAKVYGILEFVKFMNPNVEIKRTNVADYVE